jgi:hypothetical protein
MGLGALVPHGPTVLLAGPSLLLQLLLHPSPAHGVWSLLFHLPPLFLAIFLVYFRKASFDLDKFHQEFQHVSPVRKAGVSVAVMAAFVSVVVRPGAGAAPGDLGPFFLHTVAATLAVGLLDWLRMHRSTAGDWAQVVRRSEHSVGRGLARAFHAFLANTIVGIPGNSLPLTEVLADFKLREQLRDEHCWFGPRVLLLFPAVQEPPPGPLDGRPLFSRMTSSVAELQQQQRLRQNQYGLVSQTVRHGYQVAGQKRESVLHLIKQRHDKDGVWRNNYLVFAENRPLITLHQVMRGAVRAPG